LEIWIQGFEKMISGMYLGDLVRRVILRMSLESDMFGPISPKLSMPFILRWVPSSFCLSNVLFVNLFWSLVFIVAVQFHFDCYWPFNVLKMIVHYFFLILVRLCNSMILITYSGKWICYIFIKWPWNDLFDPDLIDRWKLLRSIRSYIDSQHMLVFAPFLEWCAYWHVLSILLQISN